MNQLLYNYCMHDCAQQAGLGTFTISGFNGSNSVVTINYVLLWMRPNVCNRYILRGVQNNNATHQSSSPPPLT